MLASCCFQPVTRGEILLGKFLGLFASIFTATLIGFSSGRGHHRDAGWRRRLVALSHVRRFFLVLALIFLSLSAFIFRAVPTSEQVL